MVEHWKCPRMNLMAWTKEAVGTASGKMHLLGHLGCNQWDCDYCAGKLARRWRGFLWKRIEELGGTWHMMTLTARPEDEGFEQSYKAMQRGIDVLMKRIRRVFGDVDYVRVFEAHNTRDALHAHFIVRGFVNFVAVGASVKHVPMFVPSDERVPSARMWALRTWLKKTAWECGLGYIADIQEIQTLYAVNYVVKYLTKAGQRFKIKGLRHVQTSRGIGGLRQPTEYTWKVGFHVDTFDFPDGTSVLVQETGEILHPNMWDDNQRWHDNQLWDVSDLGL